MAYVSPARLFVSSQSSLTQALLGFVLGVIFAVPVVIAAYINLKLGIGVAAAIPLIIAICLRPDWGVYFFMFLIFVVEEFPSGYGETVQRSSRTPFYSKSLFVHGLYLPDFFLVGLITLLIAQRIIARKKLPILVDRVTIALLIMGVAITVSTLLSILAGSPFKQVVIDTTSGTGTPYNVNQRGAELIALFQFKNYSYVFAAYVLGRLFFDSEQRLKQVLHVFLAGALGATVLGTIRLALHPSLVAHTIPVFYDSPSVLFFAMVIFFTIVAWSRGVLSRNQVYALVAFCAILMFFILVSFRRTMWGGIVLATPILFCFIPARSSFRLAILGILAVALVCGILMFTPLGELVLRSVSHRVEQTTTKDTSTLYRLALAVYMAHHFWQIPLFGYGATPLWNKYASLGYFRVNIENIHSLYFWLLLRTGIVGLLEFLFAISLITWKTLGIIRYTTVPLHRAVAVTLLLAFFLFLFSGVFNPVYGEARYMIPLGLGFALITCMPQWERNATAAPEG